MDATTSSDDEQTAKHSYVVFSDEENRSNMPGSDHASSALDRAFVEEKKSKRNILQEMHERFIKIKFWQGWRKAQLEDFGNIIREYRKKQPDLASKLKELPLPDGLIEDQRQYFKLRKELTQLGPDELFQTFEYYEKYAKGIRMAENFGIIADKTRHQEVSDAINNPPPNGTKRRLAPLYRALT